MTTIAEAFERALARHRQGQLGEAEAIYRQILSSQPRHAPALHMLGVLAHQANRPDVAVGMLEQAIQIEPTAARFHNSLGEALRTLDQGNDALSCFQQALKLDPDLAAAHYNMALAHQAAGDAARAIEAYRTTVRLMPQLAEAHNELGNLLRQRGELTEAMRHFDQAVALRHDFPEACNDRGNALQDLGRLDEAVASFEQALRLQPTMAAAHYNLGNALRAAGNLPRAAACYREALRHEPRLALALNNLGATLRDLGVDDEAERALAEAVRLAPELVEAHCNLGKLLKKRNELAAAQTCFQRVLELEPAHAEAHVALGATYQSLDDWQRAGECFETALRLDPNSIDANCNYGVWCTAMGQYALAMQRFDHALERRPDCAEAHCNRGMLLLGSGNFAEGWPDYEWRWKAPGSEHLRVDRPHWQGERMEGRTVLLLCEQGLGDVIQFARYAPLVRQRSEARVLLRCQPLLHPLLKSLAGVDELVVDGPRQVHFDCYAPLMSLPAIFDTRLESIPRQVPYLASDPERIARWRPRLAAGGKLKVGIAWQGDPKYSGDYFRSIPLSKFAPLAECPEVKLFSLQKYHGREQLADWQTRFDIDDLGDELDVGTGAFVDTAALMYSLDLVVTSDTAIAHLAGALGVPVWVALQFAPDWRWLHGREDSPWYPTMRLFRQEKLGDWPGVFERMARELELRVSGP